MPCCIFGVANHSPEFVVSALLKSRIASKPAEIGILPPESRADTRFQFLLLLSTEDLKRNLSRLDRADTKAFVFSNPIDLSEFHGVRNLDFVQVDDLTFNFTPLDMNAVSKSTPVTIKRESTDFLAKLIENVKHGSLLNPLMTFIYSLSSQNQNTVKSAAIRYLYNGYAERRLIEDVSQCLTERATDKLLSILSTSVAGAYASALQHVRQLRKTRKTPDLEEIAKRTSTSAYELSYMLSVIDDRTSKYSDSFDKAKNRKVPRHKRTQT